MITRLSSIALSTTVLRGSCLLTIFLGTSLFDAGIQAGIRGAAPSASGELLRIRTERSADAQVRTSAGLEILTRAGRSVGQRRANPSTGDLALSASRGDEWAAPAYQIWHASGDGRSFLGAGDPSAPEHPFELGWTLYRDGLRQVTSSASDARLRRLDPESSFDLSDDGRLAIVGHPAGDRQQWFAGVLDAQGQELFLQQLPAGRQAADPVLFEAHLLLRTHELFPGSAGSITRILRVDGEGVRVLHEASGGQQLIGFPQLQGALVRTAEDLTWIRSADGRVLWRTGAALLPAGPHAWASWNVAGTGLLAVLTSDVRRRGQPPAPVRLEVFDATDGARAGAVVLERRGPLALARAWSEREHLMVRWMETEEVFAWVR